MEQLTVYRPEGGGVWERAAPDPVVAPAAASLLPLDRGTALTEPTFAAPPGVDPCEADSPPALLGEFNVVVPLLFCAGAIAVDASNAAATTADIPNLLCIVSSLSGLSTVSTNSA
jgi:hypothetical protein